MTLPVLLVVDPDPDDLAAVERELRDRYDRHYTVVCVGSPDEVLAGLDGTWDEVALVLAATELDGMAGDELLERVRPFQPHARRALLVGWGEWGQRPVGGLISDGIAHGRLDGYVIRPTASPDEMFHQSISSLLLEWAEDTRLAPGTVHIVGQAWSGRAYELRETLQQCAISHDFCLADSDRGRSLLSAAPPNVSLPAVVFPTGDILADPSNAEIALAAGGRVDPTEMTSDVVIVGAGPAGLSAAVYGASEGFDTLVVDRGGIGGQATSSSLIRNYLGFPRGISGRRLARCAYDQAWVFGAGFTFMQTVTGLRRDGDDLLLELSESGEIRTTAVLLTMGASYNRIGIPQLEELTGAGVYYGGPTSEAPGLTGADVVIVGGANSAGQAALHLARYARRVSLVVRADSLRTGMSEYLVKEIEATPNVEVRLRTQVVDGRGDGRLEQLVLRGPDDVTKTVDADALFLLIGARPFTDWLPPEVERDDRGFVLTGDAVDRNGTWPLDREPLLLESSLPGVFAAGDVRHGSVKRVASAVGEGSVAVQLFHEYFARIDRLPRAVQRADATS